MQRRVAQLAEELCDSDYALRLRKWLVTWSLTSPRKLLQHPVSAVSGLCPTIYQRVGLPKPLLVLGPESRA